MTALGWSRLAPVPELPDLDLVVAAPHAAHHQIEYGQARRARDLLGADVEGRVLAQELRPVALIRRHRRLVGVHRHRAHDAATAQKIRQQFLRGHQPGAEARAHLEHQSLGPGIVQRLVGRIDGITRVQCDPLQQPLPVAEMRGHEHDRPPGIQVTCAATAD